MIRGNFEIVGGKGEVLDQRIRKLEGGEVGYELMEVKLKLDANGEAEARLPYASGTFSMWAVKLGDEAGQNLPTAAFNIIVVSTFGELVAINHGTNVAAAAAVVANIAPTSIATATIRGSGAVTVTINVSDPANANKIVMVALQMIPPSRTVNA